MGRNWAIAIGINSYNPNNFAPLKYAKRDAELMRDFFQEAGFDEVCFFSDDSPAMQLQSGAVIPTYPSYGNLRGFLRDRFETPFLSAGDNCWFFFAGHGMQYVNRDYLMPIDANPRDPDIAIPVTFVRERLSRSGADNIILMLDACRSEGGRDNGGVGSEVQQGVITISACSPTEKSWEIDILQQGAFTYALLEALRLEGERNCATVERLSQYLRYRVPDICRQYGKTPAQMPRISADPIEKMHFILQTKFATLTDLATLKNDAYRAAQINDNYDLSEQIWIRVLAAANGRDMEAIQALQKLALTKANFPSNRYPKSTTKEQTIKPKGGRDVSSYNDLDRSATKLPSGRKILTPQKTTRSIVNFRGNSRYEAEVNYQKLESALITHNWQEADNETYSLMCTISGRADWLRIEDMKQFPCGVLGKIDQLWSDSSGGSFGFSAQKRVYLACGGKLDGKYEEGIWNEFGTRVQWRDEFEWFWQSGIQYSLSAPIGHLPASPWIRWILFRRTGKGGLIPALIARHAKCGL